MPQPPLVRHDLRRSAAVALLSLAAFYADASTAIAQETISREYTIKAAYLYNLGRYITWPPSAFVSPQSPFVIGLIEPDYVGPDLRKIAAVKAIDDRPVVVKTFAKPDDIQPCQILFVPKSVDPAVQEEIIHRLAGKGTLLVGETEAFLDRGGAIAFVIRDNNVRLIIGLDAAHREKLQVSSKLLQIALPKL